MTIEEFTKKQRDLLRYYSFIIKEKYESITKLEELEEQDIDKEELQMQYDIMENFIIDIYDKLKKLYKEFEGEQHDFN